MPLRQPALRELGLYTRPADLTASTEFSLTRFLTPYVAASDGWTVFVDCDFLFTRDITAMLDGLDDTKAVYVVKHEYQPHHAIKMDGRAQTSYPRKNWSSFMVFNGRHPAVKALRPQVVNESSPAYLHRFEWIDRSADIGELPRDWNFLVGEYDAPAQPPAAIHYTNGGPWFEKWTAVDYGELWLAERDLYEESRNALAA